MNFSHLIPQSSPVYAPHNNYLPRWCPHKGYWSSHRWLGWWSRPWWAWTRWRSISSLRYQRVSFLSKWCFCILDCGGGHQLVGGLIFLFCGSPAWTLNPHYELKDILPRRSKTGIPCQVWCSHSRFRSNVSINLITLAHGPNQEEFEIFLFLRAKHIPQLHPSTGFMKLETNLRRMAETTPEIFFQKV